MLESLLLPSYDDALDINSPANAPRPRVHAPRRGSVAACICGFTLDSLLLKDDALLRQHEQMVKGNSTSPDEVFVENKIQKTIESARA